MVQQMAEQYAIPKVGSKVRVTSRFKDNYIYATSEFYDHTIEGVVIPSYPGAVPNSFMMRTSCKNVPIRVVGMGSVVNLEYTDGTVAKKGKVDDAVKTLEVKGSKGEKYIVIKEGSKVSCTCVGFQFRRTCKHLAMIK